MVSSTVGRSSRQRASRSAAMMASARCLSPPMNARRRSNGEVDASSLMAPKYTLARVSRFAGEKVLSHNFSFVFRQ